MTVRSEGSELAVAFVASSSLVLVILGVNKGALPINAPTASIITLPLGVSSP